MRPPAARTHAGGAPATANAQSKEAESVVGHYAATSGANANPMPQEPSITLKNAAYSGTYETPVTSSEPLPDRPIEAGVSNDNYC